MVILKGWYEWYWQRVPALHKKHRTCVVSQPEAQEPHSAGARHGSISLPSTKLWTLLFISHRNAVIPLYDMFPFFCTSVKTHLYCVYVLLQSCIGKRLELLCWWKRFCRQLYNQLNSVQCRIRGLAKSNCRVGKSTGFIHSEETKGTLCLFCTLKP